MTEQPNIILVVLDTVRAQQLGLYGRDIDPMPNLTAFAEDATVYERAYTNAPWTLPAHASLFTGQLPSEHGCHGGSPMFEPETEPLPVRLSEAGYETYGISNNIWISDHFGFERGFDTFYKQWQLFRESRDIGHVLKEDPESPTEFMREVLRGNPVVNLLNGLYGKYLYRRDDFGAVRTTDDALSLVDGADSPFFLFANYMEAHAPYMEHDCSEEFLPEGVTDPSRYTELSARSLDYHTGRLDISEAEFDAMEGLYDGELRYLDRQLGRLFEGLERRGELDDSLVVILGDHGENIGDHGLMAHRFSVHDTVTHVPLVVSYPSNNLNHSRVQEPIGFRGVNGIISSVGVELNEMVGRESESPVVTEYIDFTYTPEYRDDSFEFNGSIFDQKIISVIDSEYKYIQYKGGDWKIRQYRDGFDGSPGLSDENIRSKFKRYCDFPGKQDEDSVTSESKVVQEHLEDLGYL